MCGASDNSEAPFLRFNISNLNSMMKSFISQKNGKLSKLCLYYIEDLSFSTFMKALRKKDVKVNGKRTAQDIALSVGDKVDIFYAENQQEKYQELFPTKTFWWFIKIVDILRKIFLTA